MHGADRTEAERAEQAVIRQVQEERAAGQSGATLRAYGRCQRRFLVGRGAVCGRGEPAADHPHHGSEQAWNDLHYPDQQVSEAKVLRFLREVLVGQPALRGGHPRYFATPFVWASEQAGILGPGPVKLEPDLELEPGEADTRTNSHSTITQYVAAIKALWVTAYEAGEARHPDPRGSLVRSMLQRIREEEEGQRRLRQQAQAEPEADATVTEAEYEDVLHSLWAHRDGEYGLRHRLDAMLSLAFVARSQLTRTLRFPDLGLVELPQLGPGVIALRVTFHQSKTNRHGKREQAGALRHREVTRCPVGALALYLFFRFHLSLTTPPWPSFTCPKDWYGVPLLQRSGSTNAPLSYASQHRAITRVHRHLGIRTSNATHWARHKGARDLHQAGVDAEQIHQAGRWERNALYGCYLHSALPLAALRVLAGYGAEDEVLALPRAQVQPPMALQRRVFPLLEQSMEEHVRPGLSRCRAAPRFFRLIQALRVVVLQDAAMLMDLPQYAGHAVFTYPLLRDPAYLRWAQELRATVHRLGDIPRTLPPAAAAPATMHPVVEHPAWDTALDALSQQSLEQHQCTQELVRNLPALVGGRLDAPETGPSEPASVAHHSSDVDQHLPSTSIPQYPMLSVRTLTEAWAEYDAGLNGHPPIRELEARFGTKWRASNRVTQRFIRKKPFYLFMQQHIAQGESASAVLRGLEQDQGGRSLATYLATFKSRIKSSKSSSSLLY